MGKRIVLIGGGHAHVTALRWLAGNPIPGLDITLINSSPYAAYSGMVPGYVAGHFTREQAEIDLRLECQRAGVRFLPEEAVRLSGEIDSLETRSGMVFQFDVASLDVGIVSRPPGTPQDSAGIDVKPMSIFLDAWENLSARLKTYSTLKAMVIIGGGLGGVELAFSMRHAMSLIVPEKKITLSILDRGDSLLESAPASLRKILLRELAAASITVETNASVKTCTEDGIYLYDGRVIPSDITLWAAGAHPHAWVRESGLQTHQGFPIVRNTLQSTSHPNMFVCGDTAHFDEAPLAKAGVYAVRQGPVVMQNLIAFSGGYQLTDYHPQKDYLKLVSLGKRRAVAEKWGVTLSLPGLWHLKRHIDTRFVQNA